MLAHSLANESFNFGGRQPAHGPDTPRLPVQEGRRKVIAILDPSVTHMAWGHSVAAVVIDAADQHGFGFGACDRVVVALLIEPKDGPNPLGLLFNHDDLAREVTSERIRDKIAASKRKGLWVGASPRLDMPPRTYNFCCSVF